MVKFEYVRHGLRIKTMSTADHKAATALLQAKGVEFFTHNPNPGNNTKFILKGPPPNMTCEEVVTGLSRHGVAISHCRQIKRTLVEDNVRTAKALPLWVITVDKSKKNLDLLKAVREIIRFQIRIEDFKNSSKSIQCFRCQNFGHKAEFCNLKDRCVKCDGNHNTRACVKAAGTPPKCTNCGGEHPANYRGCPTAKQYEERGY